MVDWIIRCVVCVAPAVALAAPGEDHWTVEMDPAVAADLAESVRLIEDDRYCEALPLLEDLAEALPANADVFNMLGYAHRKMGDLALSGAHYARALHLKPDHLGALEYQGELFLRLGDLDGALENLGRLEAACAEGCEERDDLDAAIRAWRAR